MSRTKKQIIGPLTQQQTDSLVWKFHLAASGQWGKTRKLKRLIAEGAPLDAQDNIGWTALHYAANQGHLASVRALLDAGACVDIREDDNMTPLMRAAYNGKNEVVALLLKHGSDLSATDNKGRTALMLAASEGYLKTVRYLAHLGIDISATDGEGRTAREIALSKRQTEIAQFMAQEELLKAIAAGTRPDMRIDGLTALHHAAQNGEVSDVRKALKAGVPVDARDDNGLTPLMTAAAFDFRLAAASLLLKKGASVDAADAFGRTALMIAAANGAYETLELLLLKGASPDAVDRTGCTASSYAHDGGYSRLADELFDAEAAQRERKETESIHAATTLARPLSVKAPLRFR